MWFEIIYWQLVISVSAYEPGKSNIIKKKLVKSKKLDASWPGARPTQARGVSHKKTQNTSKFNIGK